MGLEREVQMKVYVHAEVIAWLEFEEKKKKRSRSYLVNEALEVRMNMLEKRRKQSTEGRSGRVSK